MTNLNVAFCGLSKNCINTIDENIKHIVSMRNNYREININLFIVDSDSSDGTKEIISKYEKDNEFIVYRDLDDLEKNYNSRIERITLSRNLCLDELKLKNYDNLIYIPIDLDVNLFELTDIESFHKILNSFVNQNTYDAIFPISSPNYYDIFALRAKGWHNLNSSLLIHKIKKIIFFGSFFLNYFLIFRQQLTVKKIKSKNFNVISAFGGAGMYKLINNKLFQLEYMTDKSNPEHVSEHILFNSNFENLDILSDWVIPAPAEHVRFHTLTFKEKIVYFMKTIKNDFKQKLFIK